MEQIQKKPAKGNDNALAGALEDMKDAPNVDSALAKVAAAKARAEEASRVMAAREQAAALEAKKRRAAAEAREQERRRGCCGCC